MISLYEVGIVPQIVDPFVPQLRVHVSWPNTGADLGNTPNVSLLQPKPTVWFTNISSTDDVPTPFPRITGTTKAKTTPESNSKLKPPAKTKTSTSTKTSTTKQPS